MKKLVLISLVTLALTGCATNRQNGEVLGAITGAAAGKTLGGTGGAIIGAAVGAAAGGAVGQNMDNQQYGSQPVIVSQVPQDQIYYSMPPNVVYVQPYWPAPYAGMRWVYVQRYGWGWHHHHHGFYHRPHHRHYR